MFDAKSSSNVRSITVTNLATACENLRQLPPPSHLQPNYTYPPIHTANVYNRGDAGHLLTSASKKSSILVALTEFNNEIHVVLTRRTPTMRKHSGQVAFPGGKNEQGDVNDFNAAMRESFEEIKLPNLNIDPLTHLRKNKSVRYTVTGELCTILDFHIEASPPHYVTIQMSDGREKQTTTEKLTVSGINYIRDLERLVQPAFNPPLVVTPIIVTIDYDEIYSRLTPNEDECNAIFLAPLMMFLQSSRKHSICDLKHSSGLYRMHHFMVQDNHTIFDVWGMTADVCIYVASVVYKQRPNFAMNEVEDNQNIYPPSLLFSKQKNKSNL
jgi:8-oxo-dGTP pyrophosphatase MutT (NUDIX family)